MIRAYYRRLNERECISALEAAAQAWSIWEASALKLIPDQKLIDEFSEPEKAIALARIECHYFMNNCFFETDNYLIENVDRIRHIPGSDCAWSVRHNLSVDERLGSASRLAGSNTQDHSRRRSCRVEPGITDALVRATDSFR